MDAVQTKQDFLEDIRHAARAQLSPETPNGFAAVVLGLVANAIRERDRERKDHFEQLTAARLALRDMVDLHDGECQPNRDGYCQVHAFDMPCPVGVARTVLDES